MRTFTKIKFTRFIYFIGFIIWPLGTTLLSFLKTDKWLKNILWLFVIFSGYNFVIATLTMDANFYRDVFWGMTNSNYTYDVFYSEYLGENRLSMDFLFPLLSFLVSRLTSDFRILFAFMGAIFGFFYSRNVWYILSRVKGYNGYISKILMLTFLIIVGFWQINGFRFWTATHIFFYAVIPYVLEKDKKYLWFLALAVFTHFSFVLPISILFLYKFLKNRPTLYFYLFLASVFVTGVDLEFVKENILRLLPSFFQNKVTSYTNVSYLSSIKEKKESLSLLARIFASSLPIFINTLFIVISIKYKKELRNNQDYFNLFNFSLLFMGVANFLSVVPSVGRFRIVAFMFSLTLLILYFSNKKILYQFKLFATILSPLLLGYCIGNLRLGANKIGVMTLIGNPLFVIIEEFEKSFESVI